MAFRIEIRYKVPDARSVSKCGFFNALIAGQTSKADKSARYKGMVKNVKIVDCYTVDARMSPKQMEAAAKLLTNSLIEEYKILRTKNQEPRTKQRSFNYAIEISYLPGVTDNVGHTAKETIADGLKAPFKPGENVYPVKSFTENNKKPDKKKFKKISKDSIKALKTLNGVYSSQVLFISGKLDETDIKKITGSLYNPLIQRATIKSFAEFKKDKGFAPNLPKVNLHNKVSVLEVDLNLTDEALAQIGKQGITDPKTKLRRGPLSLDLDQLKVIRSYFHRLGRNPTDVELETLAQTWSEHCKHTIFADPLDEIKDGIYRHYIKRATEIIRKKMDTGDFCVSVFSDNSGGIVFDDKYLITHKVETHNSPSALDPFGGSVTGIGGVNRDALGFGLGAKPIINTYGFCLGNPDDKTMLYRDAEKQSPMLSARRIMDGVVAGINAGGNQSGIPTNSGFLYFDSQYRGKPLVFAGTVGLIPHKINGKPSHVKQAKPGDFIVMIGGRVGLDGIHGATFSSEGLDAHSPATAVQIGDPITQKKFSDAIVREARDLGLYNSITDCGAGGLSSAVGEMATQSHGCQVDLHRVPLKYPGLAPWQIWISESQERMVLAVPPKSWDKFKKLVEKRGVESTIIGKFTSDGKCVLKYKNQTVMDVDLDFLHDGRPVKMQISKFQVPSSKQIQNSKFQTAKANVKSSILNLLKQPSIASRSFLATQYDHEVQGGSVTKPLQGKGRVDAEATITRPVLTSQKGVVLAYGLYPEYSETDAYKMAGAAIDTAIRNAVCAGANLNHLALLDNFCWPEGNDPYRLWQLKQAAKACFDYSVAFGTPFISGKDSMFNDFKGFDNEGQPIKISIPPTLLISAISVIDDANKSITLDAKMPGDLVYLLGETKDEMGGSEYERIRQENSDKRIENRIGHRKSEVPNTNAKKNLKLYQALQKAIEKELVASAIPLTRGGLATALCKTAIAGQLGMTLEISNSTLEIIQLLFSESQGRILVTLNPKNARKFEKQMQGNKIYKLGTITEDKIITLHNRGEKIIIPLSEATAAYHSTFKNF